MDTLQMNFVQLHGIWKILQTMWIITIPSNTPSLYSKCVFDKKAEKKTS